MYNTNNLINSNQKNDQIVNNNNNNKSNYANESDIPTTSTPTKDKSSPDCIVLFNTNKNKDFFEEIQNDIENCKWKQKFEHIFFFSIILFFAYFISKMLCKKHVYFCLLINAFIIFNLNSLHFHFIGLLQNIYKWAILFSIIFYYYESWAIFLM